MKSTVSCMVGWRQIGRGMARVALCFILVVSLSFAPGAGALALTSGELGMDNTETAGTPADDTTLAELAANTHTGNDVFDFLNKEDADKKVEQLAAQAGGEFPASFDLRNVDTDGDGVGDSCYVTPVKYQHPFGSCWAFSAMAAAETSLLSSGLAAKDGYNADTLNLSEKHTMYFAATPIDDPESSQNGEGFAYSDDVSTVEKLDIRGCTPFGAARLFASGIGPNREDREYPEASGKTGSMEDVLGYHGANKIIEKLKTFIKKNNQYLDQSEWVDLSYSANDDWSINQDYRFCQSYKLQESNCLPSPAGTDANGNYEYNPAATEIFKSELMAGRGVAIGYNGYGPTSSKNWAQYAYEPGDGNHAVTIVGWDDNYSKENFVEKHQPPADGAWLVKNSFGSGEEAFPNYSDDYGIIKTDASGNPVLDEDGNYIHTGYFWLSYYDQTIVVPTTYEFEANSEGKTFHVDQYDLTTVNDVRGWDAQGEVRMANVFHVGDKAMSLERVSCQTSAPGTDVTYNVYLLPNNYRTPNGGFLAATVTKTYEYGGYHEATLDAPVKLQPGQYYAVEVIQQAGDRYTMNMMWGHSQLGAEIYNWDRWTVAVVNKGESFLYTDGKYIDLTDEGVFKEITGEQYLYYVFDNFPIKAFLTEEAERDDPLGDISIRIDRNRNLMLGSLEKNELNASLHGTSEVPKDAKIEWTCTDPAVLDLIVPKSNDSYCQVSAKKIGIAFVAATLEGARTAVCQISVLPPPCEVVSLTLGEAGSGQLFVELEDQRSLGVDTYQIAYTTEDTYDWQYVYSKTPSLVLENLEKGKRYWVSACPSATTPYGLVEGDYGKDKLSDVIPKAANTLAVKGKTVEIGYNNLKKKAQTIKRKKAMSVKKAVGTTTYELKSVNKAKFKKYFKVNENTGDLKVKKGLPKGTYRVNVSVTAAGNADYDASTKTATVKVKVR